MCGLWCALVIFINIVSFSKYRNKDRDHSSCSSPSSPSPEPQEDREVRKERDEGSSGFKSFQGHTDGAVFQGRGRSRGNFVSAMWCCNFDVEQIN